MSVHFRPNFQKLSTYNAQPQGTVQGPMVPTTPLTNMHTDDVRCACCVSRSECDYKLHKQSEAVPNTRGGVDFF